MNRHTGKGDSLLYGIEECLVDANEKNFLRFDSRIAVLTGAELKEKGDALGIPPVVIDYYEAFEDTLHESCDGYDVFVLSVPNLESDDYELTKICVYFSKDTLVFITETEPQFITKAVELGKTSASGVYTDKFLFWVYERMLKGDTKHLQSIEDKISELDAAVLEDEERNFTDDILIIRQKLVFLKQHYERILDIAENIEEDENGLLSPRMKKYFGNNTNRVERLIREVLTLRDAITQVREAYQAEMDLRLNSIMKIFTVITSVFLPLTLITSWYGMNLMMPEVAWPFGYPVVICLSVVVVVLCIAFFRWKKWF